MSEATSEVNECEVSSEELVRLFADDQQKTLGILFEKYSPVVYRVVRSAITQRVGNQYESDELVNSTFLSVILRMKNPNAAPILSFTQYFKMVARNKIFDADRKVTSSNRKSNFEVVGDIQAEESIAPVVALKDRSSEEVYYNDLVQLLKERIGEITAIAKELNLSRRTVHRMVKNAREYLEKTLMQ